MEKDEYQEEVGRVSDLEVVKIKSVFDKTNLFLLRSSLQLISGNVDNFIRGITLSELTLRPKLDDDYKDKIKKERIKIENDDRISDPKFELALFKYGEINDFLDRQTPVRVHTALM